MEHPDPDDLLAFAGGEIASERRDQIDAHIDGCPSCADLVVALARAYGEPGATLEATLAAGTSRTDALAPGGRLERFHVLDEIGRGAMGVVYAAYDPDLDRRVALKVLRRRAAADRETDVRFLREAQAMARLQHPNVITVHEARMIDGRLYISMEFVEGGTLTRWLRSAERSWTEVLAVFEQIASGLAAAHAAGLVHRDIKPDNVLVGGDPQGAHGIGRVRVTDFGLARPVDSASDEPSASAPTLAALSTELTRTGTLLGTPAYMAPEQFRGEPADAASDQFAYCVAFHEALFGTRPFEGQRVGELAANVLEGRRVEPPADRGVPRWLRAVVVRGLASDPAARHPSMDALLGELQRGDRAPSRRRQLGAVVAALAIGGVSTVAVGSVVAPACSNIEQRRRLADCDDAAAELDTAWNDDVRAEVRAAFHATAVVHADATADRFIAELDRFTGEWSEVRRTSCTTAVEHASALFFDAATTECLHDRRAELEALVEGVRLADPELVSEAVPAAAVLPRPSQCADAVWIARHTDFASDEPAVRELRGRLRRAETMQTAGREDEALALAREVEAAATALGHETLRISATWRIGVLQQSAGQHDEAARTIESAFHAAWQDGEDLLAADIARTLVLLSAERGHAEDGLHWAAIAQSTYDRAHEPPDTLSRAWLAMALASVHEKRGEFDTARADLRLALEILERRLGPDHVLVGRTLGNLGVVLTRAGEVEEAERVLERVLALYERALGPDHPSTATILNNLGGALLAHGELERAQACFERALAVRERVFGPDHADVAGVLNNLGNVYLHRERPRDALAAHERAERIMMRVYGADHPRIAASMENIATVLYHLGDHDGAIDRHRRALEILGRTAGPNDLVVAVTRGNLGNVLFTRGRYRDALVEFEGALATFDAVAPDHPDAVFTLLGLGDTLLALDRPADAVPFLERLLAHDQRNRLGETDLDGARRSLDRARAAAGSRAGAR